MWWLLVVVFVTTLAYWKLVQNNKYWLKKGVKQGNPGILLGDYWSVIVKKQSFATTVEKLYNQHPKARYLGFYHFLRPTLFLRDPDLIKQITVKDFDHFVDHHSVIPEDCDPLWSRNLFALTGIKWRSMRATLSSTFTSSKMKFMFSLVAQKSQQFVDYFLTKEVFTVELEMKDAFTRFTSDTIASVAFGVECDSLVDKDNEFYLRGKQLTNFRSFWRMLKFLGFVLVPKLYKALGLSLFPQKVADFFTTLIRNNIDRRLKSNIVRPDMIHILLEARFDDDETTSKDTGFATAEESEISKTPRQYKARITDADIISHALLFFFAGFETVATTMCFMSYELAVNPEVQDKLIEEVDRTLEFCQGKLSYDDLLGMKYMDMVVCETLRKWPSVVAVDRVCTKPYTIQAKYPDEKPVCLEENDSIWLPIFGLHRSPEYYPNPERFDPGRFSDEKKDKIKPYTFLPFGSGPRNCIGSRLGLLEVKTLFFYILTNFRIIPVEKTQTPLVVSHKEFKLTAEGGVWLGLERRFRV